MKALILAGGLGTRLSSVVSDRAKPVAMVSGRPFVEYLLAQLHRCQKIESVVICVGHKANTVRQAIGNHFGRLPVTYSHERDPLGTGGAMRLALASGTTTKSATLAMNGDSFLGIRLDRLVEYHVARKPMVTVALARVPDASRFGATMLDGDRIKSFREKGVAGPAWINAGIYVLSEEATEAIRSGPTAFSFEREALSAWCRTAAVLGLRSKARFIDIGTPEEYARSALVLQGRT